MIPTPYKIERDIPISEGRQNPESHLGLLRTTLNRMKPGDSFVYDAPSYQNLYIAARNTNSVITIRKLDTGGWRVWLRNRKSKIKNQKSP